MSYYSTTAISKIYGLKAKPLVFEYLCQNGYIFHSDTKPYYRLTQLGEKFGKMFDSDSGQKWVVWDIEKFAPVLQRLKLKIIHDHSRKFNLYHMTHIDNLLAIGQRGSLLPHNQLSGYRDISNQSVNARRAGEEPIFNYSTHDYVPLYFNVRNAMLYTVQKTFGSKVIILEMKKEVCLSPYTLYTYKNAAADDALFYFDIVEFLDEANWGDINSYTWFDDPTNTLKKAMMSECLVYHSISNQLIEKIHCKTKECADEVIEILNQQDSIEVPTVYYGSNLFFS